MNDKIYPEVRLAAANKLPIELVPFFVAEIMMRDEWMRHGRNQELFSRLQKQRDEWAKAVPVKGFHVVDKAIADVYKAEDEAERRHKEDKGI